ncbi:uncharacterized protein Dmoj_GI23922, isoform G [Drosophila mojavensis]|uniref:Uncharacterized protein, isoform A n=1 Tax=Drosophila mojavensis TaxID=7230 RepID=B4KDI8_DROMO|nr:uncharacterized protein Dmoj_GI23922, isoform A [Drosophila mojavensis]KRG00659.1 uncharacterized protein Dmoj_GI23922, isoform G [Drosophila mojavensis]
MDTDTEDDAPRAGTSDVIKHLLEIANSRPSTNVAKAILAYHESASLATLLLVLEEVSKNTDFSTDLRLSLSYYMDEFLRQVSGSKVPRRSVIAAAGNVLQYCSKVYGDRVEYMYQVVEHQIEALLIADPKKDENTNNNKDASKPEEPRKRRVKKLTQKEFDPFSYKMEPKKFKIMSEEKRFSRVGFETNRNRNRTVEHMYQDHTPSHMWKYASIMDPANPYEKDEKKNYKVFTYHPEPRYNTLLPDIQFDRLNLIKEYVNRNQVNLSDTLNRNMSNKEYLDEYIALENQMLASRYGEKSLLKRTLIADEKEKAKRLRLELENLQKPLLHSSGQSPKRMRLADDVVNSEDMSGVQPESMINDSFKTTFVDTMENHLEESSLAVNDASCMDSTRLDQQTQQKSHTDDSQLQLELSSASKGDENNEQLLQIDSGIGMDDAGDTLPAAQSFDDEGVVLTDLIEEQRLHSLSPKVMVHDILPGVPDKANLSVRVDAEMLALSGINETIVEEIIQVQRDVHFAIRLNLFLLPEKKLRRDCMFKLNKEFDIFKKARIPSKRQTEPKAAPAPRIFRASSPTNSSTSQSSFLDWPLDQMEFDADENFRGFRRPTYDSGIDQEEARMSNSPADDGIIADVDTDGLPDLNAIEEESDPAEIQPARSLEQTEKDMTLPEILLDAAELNKTQPIADDTIAQNIKKENTISLYAPAENITELSNVDTANELDQDWDAESCNSSFQENCNSIDAETDAKIIDWHRRLAPTLEAAHARQNFSIRDLNDEIIAKCQERGGVATLADVLEDKDPTKLCCYMLSSLLLTNQRNVDLQIDKRDKSKPIEMKQFKMNLISTERKQVNPEDDIGNMDNACHRGKQVAGTSQKTKTPLHQPQHCLKTVNVNNAKVSMKKCIKFKSTRGTYFGNHVELIVLRKTST